MNDVCETTESSTATMFVDDMNAQRAIARANPDFTDIEDALAALNLDTGSIRSRYLVGAGISATGRSITFVDQSKAIKGSDGRWRASIQ